MRKCDFSKVETYTCKYKFSWKVVAYFRNTFLRNTFEGLLYQKVILWLFPLYFLDEIIYVKIWSSNHGRNKLFNTIFLISLVKRAITKPFSNPYYILPLVKTIWTKLNQIYIYIYIFAIIYIVLKNISFAHLTYAKTWKFNTSIHARFIFPYFNKFLHVSTRMKW